MKVPALLLLALLLGGCAAGPAAIKKIISPSQGAYDRADALLQKKHYDAAISAFSKFIEMYPQNNLVCGAWLGIAWARYGQGQYKETVEALTKARTTDPGLRAWIEKLKNDAQKQVAQSNTATSTTTLFNIPAATNQPTIKIEGTAPAQGKVTVNGKESAITNGLFSQSVDLTDGENTISVDITDKDGKTESKSAKVTLDRNPPQIKITSAEVDDFGYVLLTGTTKPGSQVTIGNDSLNVDSKGNFKGQVKWPSQRQVTLVARDQAGNTGQEVFAHNEYPDRPTGLRLRSVYGGNLADIEWNENTEADIKGYNVYCAKTGESSFIKNNREVIRGTTYTMENLQRQETYTVQIRAVDKMLNESEPSRDNITVAIP